jgi:acyl-coenzyme A synthetase/AMP-(fatty) acid ligase/acyl carrier protein
MWTAYPFTEDEHCCQKTALNFIDSLWEIFGPLLRGVPVSVIPDAVVKDPVALVHTLATQRITRVVLVPALLRAICDTHADLAQQLPAMRYLTASGEAVPLDLAQRLAELLPQATLLNLYGSSEVTADATYHDLRRSPARDFVPIGRPLANTTAHVLDQEFQPVPIGVPGEICVGGAGLARGYHGRPELTAEKFIPDPFSATPGARLYRTGDCGRWRANGTLEYLGRFDFQVKLRGFRIELGEIEAALRQIPAISDAVVIAREDRPGDKQVVAYIVPQDGHMPTANELRNDLLTKLPEYMIPSTFVPLERLPLTANGKVNRRALPAPDGARLESGTTFVEPRSATEKQVAALWRNVLKLERVGIYDNFFTLGGHSLLATQLIAHLHDTFQIDLPLRRLFASPTVAGIAEMIDTIQWMAQSAAVPVAADDESIEEGEL